MKYRFVQSEKVILYPFCDVTSMQHPGSLWQTKNLHTSPSPDVVGTQVLNFATATIFQGLSFFIDILIKRVGTMSFQPNTSKRIVQEMPPPGGFPTVCKKSFSCLDPLVYTLYHQ